MRRLLALLAALLAGCASVPDRTYVNPVLDRDFPDPAVLRAPDGWFFAYATQTAISDKIVNIQVARSPDLVRWEHLGDALPEKPRWAATKQKFWAPHVIHDREQDTYFMYYSAEPDQAEGKCLAVATSRSASGPFVDSGTPLLCGRGIEHIDPMAFDDPRTGKRLLYWGSGSGPIRVQELAPDRLRFLQGSAPKEVIFPDATKPYRSLVEGAWVVFRNGTYYLFYSGDHCCARAPRYAVMVARAGNAMGPFEELAEPVLKAGAAFAAPGHNSLITDDAGNDWIVYHAYHEAGLRHGQRRRVMLLDRIAYRDGRPLVAGSEPSTGPQAAPALLQR